MGYAVAKEVISASSECVEYVLEKKQLKANCLGSQNHLGNKDIYMSKIDPISNLTASLNNKIALNKKELSVPYSKFRAQVLKVLRSENIIVDFEILKNEHPPMIKIILNDIFHKYKIISKPGKRIYVRAGKFPRNDRATIIVSTSKGLMTAKNAKIQRVGGELIMEVV